jgi:hypothetical protein
MFVLMLHGFPISASLPEDLGLGERFWYWRGASGVSYIHSIYARESCPPLNGGVVVLVSCKDGVRRPIAVCGVHPGSTALPSHVFSLEGADEVHVHLLARDGAGIDHVLQDLCAAMEEPLSPATPAAHLCGPVQLKLLAA